MTAEGVPAISRLPSEIWQEHAFIQRFQVQAELGSGGQAVVVSAYHRELDERVALKFLLPEVAQSTAAVARFRREARAAAKIKNEHVVRIFDVCSTESGLPYIVMEHLMGYDLEHCLQVAEHHQLEVEVALDFILQASEALAEGHRLGIVHRDLKPANLFCVDRDDGSLMIKVLDFGISKIKPLAGDVERTDRFEILGSPRYMSPEQIDASRDVDLRTDIWSLGVILYEALAGRAPFASDIVAELWHLVRTATPVPLPALRPDVPLAVNEIVMKCLEKERTRRYANLGELADALYYIVAPRSRHSIERIRHMSGTPPALHSSAPAIATDNTLPAASTTRRLSRPRSILLGLGLAATALAGLAATRFVSNGGAWSDSGLQRIEPSLTSASLTALPAVIAKDKPERGKTAASQASGVAEQPSVEPAPPVVASPPVASSGTPQGSTLPQPGTSPLNANGKHKERSSPAGALKDDRKPQRTPAGAAGGTASTSQSGSQPSTAATSQPSGTQPSSSVPDSRMPSDPGYISPPVPKRK